jgi:hypothetical protein
MKKLFVIGLAAFGLAACQTPSQSIVVENSKNVNIIANNTAAQPGGYYGGYYAAPMYAAPQQQCIWARTSNPYYQSRICN